MFVLPELPFAYDALEPFMSARTLRFRHDKHHAGYLKALNEQLAAAGKSAGTLEAVILDASKADNRALFNNAAQVWNHSCFWLAMVPKRERPTGSLAVAIDKSFGGLAHLKTAFVKAGTGQFGSGWVWLVSDHSGNLRVRSTHDADDTVTQADTTPLLVCDLWEHAYYLDHQNDRKGFLEAWFDALPNWQFAASQYEAAQGRGEPWRHPAPLTSVDLKMSKASLAYLFTDSAIIDRRYP